MKKLLFLLILNSFLSCTSDDNSVSIENIYTGDVSLNTQAEVDSFGSNNYTEIIGDLYIGDPNFVTDINNLNLLSTLQEVGNLTIYTDELVNFNGLNNLSVINGFCSIRSVNIDMENFDGLNGLTQINGDFGIGRSLFKNLIGLENLSTIGGNLNISLGYELTSLSGFEIITIGGDFEIKNCNLLTNLLGVESLTTLNGDLYIENNELLSDFCDLTNFLANGSFGEVIITNNLFNPSSDDIINNNCSL